MISSYRLGELVFVYLLQCEKDNILTEYPNTIGSEYILEDRKRNITHDNKIDFITNIVLKHIQQNIDLLPKDIEQSTVMHLRLGDAVGGNKYHEKTKRPIDVNYLQTIVPNNNKMYVIGKCFFGSSSSNNYDECICLSDTYLENIINIFNAEHFDGGSADIDLCCAVKSKCFIQGRGYFSKLIVEIRKKLNLENIETNIHV